MGEEQEQAGAVRASVEWLQDLSKMGHELEAITLDGLEVLQARRGFFRCSFTVPSYLSDQAGNWQVGAMATMIDAVGAAAILSATGHVKASVDFNISYLATVKIQEEVVIEAKVVGDKERLTSVIVEVTRKENGELVALAKQWMASHNNAVAVAATTTKATKTNNPSMKRLQEKEDEPKEAFTIEGLALEGLEIVESQKGYFLCSFIIPSSLSDGDGNWHVGAMATLIDSVGAVAINFSAGGIKASLDFNISYYNTAKIHEEVVIEAKVVREMEGLSAAQVEIRNKSNGQLVALGKQWLASKKNVTLGKASKL